MAPEGASLVALLRRRSRLIAFGVVAMIGTAVFAALADDGHEPRHTVAVDRAVRLLFPDARLSEKVEVSEVVVAPEGDVVYTLVRFRGAERALAAWNPEDGSLAWVRPLNTSSATLAAGRGWVAATTAFPLATLMAFDARDGALRFQELVPGNPLALAADGATLALAYQAAGNPVLVLRDFADPVTVAFPGFVRALDVANGTVAGGTQGGQVLAWREGRVLLNTSGGASVRSIRLDATGSILVVGGFSPDPVDLSGAVSLFALPENGPGRLVWSRITGSGVSFVDVSADGRRILAMQERPGRFILDFFDASRDVLWTFDAEGAVAHNDDGSNAGAALSRDGRHVVVAPLAGDIVFLDLDRREARWTYGVVGATSASFGGPAGNILATDARTTAQRGYDRLLLFDPDEEPLIRDPDRLVPMLVTLEALAVATILAWDAAGAGRPARRD
ncbi:MAG TPA: hypothetical protein VM889_13860 [Candidatus Thermoplasmatota archaeon]|nr:hypothetical protein [Candidatus Thermoplasmatota archaeon]